MTIEISHATTGRGAQGSTDATPASSHLMPAVLAGLAWAGIWLGIDSGPAVLTQAPGDWLEWAHLIRTAAPLLLLLGLGPLELARGGAGGFPGAAKFWLVYGLIGLATCLLSPDPLAALYWAGCYLSAFMGLAAFLHSGDALRRAVQLNYLSWIIATLFLGALLYLARDVLLEGSGINVSAYGAYGRVEEIGGLVMSRASGLARFAAIPGIAGFSAVWFVRGWKKIPALVITLGSVYLIWALQSRGAMIAFAVAIAFVMLFLGAWPRLIGVVLLLLLAGTIAGSLVSEDTYQQVMDHVTRGQDPDELRSMTGRTRAWESAMHVAMLNPLGRGPQADRIFLGEHVHNTYLYALLEAGWPGVAIFSAGMVWAWFMFFRAMSSNVPRMLNQREFLVQAGAVLAFFTVRGIPEVSGAMYGVDLMVMLPVIAYLGLLDRRVAQHSSRASGARPWMR